MRKIYFAIALPLLLAACGNEQPASQTYTFSGEVVVINNCNRMEEELPERIKVAYTFGEAGSGEQLVDLIRLNSESKTGKFSIKITTTKEVSSYQGIATRPNGKSICLQLPCPSPYGCREQSEQQEIPLKKGVTEITDTIKVNCSCEI